MLPHNPQLRDSHNSIVSHCIIKPSLDSRVVMHENSVFEGPSLAMQMENSNLALNEDRKRRRGDHTNDDSNLVKASSNLLHPDHPQTQKNYITHFLSAGSDSRTCREP